MQGSDAGTLVLDPESPTATTATCKNPVSRIMIASTDTSMTVFNVRFRLHFLIYQNPAPFHF
jgi:hypothetical protein